MFYSTVGLNAEATAPNCVAWGEPRAVSEPVSLPVNGRPEHPVVGEERQEPQVSTPSSCSGLGPVQG